MSRDMGRLASPRISQGIWTRVKRLARPIAVAAIVAVLFIPSAQSVLAADEDISGIDASDLLAEDTADISRMENSTDVDADTPATTSTEDDPGLHATAACTGETYRKPTKNKGKVLKKIGPALFHNNRGSRDSRDVFTSTASATVGVSAAADLKMSAGAIVGKVEQTCHIDVSVSIKAEIGHSTNVITPPHTRSVGQYGVYRQKVVFNKYQLNARCDKINSHNYNTYSPWRVGWDTWEENI
jgi:hypothetical protein